MRHLMTSFIALHWATFFAVLGYLCIDGGAHALDAVFGASGAQDFAPQGFAAPAAVAFLVVAALFFWMFANIWLSGERRDEFADDAARIAFVAAGATLSLIFIGSMATGPAELPGVVLCLAFLMVCYVAVLGERRVATVATTRRQDAAVAIRSMAQGAAHTSLLQYISGRPDSRGGR